MALRGRRSNPTLQLHAISSYRQSSKELPTTSLSTPLHMEKESPDMKLELMRDSTTVINSMLRYFEMDLVQGEVVFSHSLEGQLSNKPRCFAFS